MKNYKVIKNGKTYIVKAKDEVNAVKRVTGIKNTYSPADIKVGTRINHKGKGVYTVISVSGNEAIIQYDDGKKYRSSTVTIAEDLNNAGHIYWKL